MGRYCQMVMGPAGSGKSTYCGTAVQHCEESKRVVHIVNLDPAAEELNYTPAIDIRDLISLDDVMSELSFGPNGGLIYCMEFLAQNLDWLEEELGSYEDDYVIFDCPGQIELYTHCPIMKTIVDALRGWDYAVCGVYLLDAHFVVDTSKYFSGVLSAMAAMVQLEVPHINLLSKFDLVSAAGGTSAVADAQRFLNPDSILLASDGDGNRSGSGYAGPRHRKLNEAIAQLIDDYSLVSFIPLSARDSESVGIAMAHCDHAIQYGEDLEVQTHDYEEAGNDE